MASTFPTSLDNFTNPTATSLLTSPSHSLSHSDLNDAVEALEAKVAIGNTVLGTYIAYTPTINNFTIGNGTITSAYCQVNKLVHYYGKFVYGSTSTFGAGNVTITLPINPDFISSSPFLYTAFGTTSITDASAGATYVGVAQPNGAGTAFFASVINTAGTYTAWIMVNATTPMTWAAGDYITWNLIYRIA